jgi:hypothetical protein
MGRIAPVGASLRRGITVAAVASAGAMLSWAAACGLSVEGLSSRTGDGGEAMDATRPDDGGDSGPGSGGDAEASAPACTTIDAACLGTLPPGWQPVAISDAGCAAGYTTQSLLANPRLNDGGCACGACQLIGAFDCNAGVAVAGGDGCGDPTLITVTSGVCGVAQAQHIQATPPTATGTVGCFVPSDAGTGVTADTVTLCVPGCTVDYCQAGKRCIVADGTLPCPTGFTLQATAGTGADPGCAPCACEAGAPGACGGTVTVYDNATCTDSGAAVTYPVGTCNEYSTDYESVLVQLTPPAASCRWSTADVGDASLTGVKTICCQ